MLDIRASLDRIFRHDSPKGPEIRTTDPLADLSRLTQKERTGFPDLDDEQTYCWLPALTIDEAEGEKTGEENKRFLIQEDALTEIIPKQEALDSSPTSTNTTSGQSIVVSAYDTHLHLPILAKISRRPTTSSRAIRDETFHIGQNESIYIPTALDRTKVTISQKEYDVILMKEVPGCTLEDILKADPSFFVRHPEQLKRIARRLAQAIDSVHSGGLLHLDIKPSNIMIYDISGEAAPTATEMVNQNSIADAPTMVVDEVETYVSEPVNGDTPRENLTILAEKRPVKVKPIPPFVTKNPENIEVKLIDFGSSVPLDEAANLSKPEVTHPFAAPEVLKRISQIGNASDIHALGMTFFSLLSRVPVEYGYSGRHTLTGQQLHHGTLPDSIYRVLSRATAFEPTERYGTAAEFTEELIRAIDEAWQPTSKENLSQGIPTPQVDN